MKSTRKRLIKDCDELWSLCIRTRDNFICQWCGKQGRDAHHIVTRGSCGQVGRWELKNGVTLCFYCHRVKKNSKSVEYTRWLEGWLKPLSYDKLNEKSAKIVIYKTDNLINLKTKLEGKLKKLKEGSDAMPSL